MKTRYHLYIGLAMLALVASCKPTLNEFTPEGSTEVDFTKYVAIGNSLTSGFADGGLYLEGQKVAFPNLIADKLKEVGGGEFQSPFFSEAQKNGSGYIRLQSLTNGSPVMAQVTTELAYRAPGLLQKYTEPIQNLGVPGMRLDMAFAPGIGTAAGNMYFERLLPDGTSPTQTYFAYSTSQNHTFFSFWLGNNDVLGYATNGAVTEGATSRLTPLPEFTTRYTSYIEALTAAEQKGIVATIPDVTSTPHFTTVTRTALLQAANAAAPGANLENIFIETKTGTRPATDKDFFVLPFSSTGLLGTSSAENPYPYGLHPNNPVADKYVLDEAEAVEVKERTDQFNAVIKQVADSKGLAIADAHAYLNQVKGGLNMNGMLISSAFIQGNVFSLDGIHLTPIGNALLANLFIDAINAKYRTKIAKVDFSLYRGVKYP